MTDQVLEGILERIMTALSPLPFVEGVVLGGSRAAGTAAEDSDIDIGIYYNRETIDYDKLNEAARQLDDGGRENLVCREGGWGSWVNCGGWLIMEGIHVDLILRDMARVIAEMEACEAGHVTSNYQTGHPHAYLNVMYRGELAVSQVLYAKNEAFTAWKKRAEAYPERMRVAILSQFLFESDFSCVFAEKYWEKGDAYYLAGHLFRSVSALNQVLFALNRTYCLNEKKAVLRIEEMALRPDEYGRKVNDIFHAQGGEPEVAAKRLRALCDEVKDLAEQGK